MGFRYEYEVPGADSILVTDELTAFNIAQDGTSWSIPANYDTYELLYRTQPVSRIDNANTPMTFKTGGLYASIHEAALTDFPEMTLKNTGNCNFKSELAPWPDEEAYICTVQELAAVAKKHNITKTALVLVGDVISNQHYTRSRLYAPDFTTEFRKAKTPKNAEDDRLMRDTDAGKELPE